MAFHDFTRQAALSIPRVRRFYEYVRALENERNGLKAEREELARRLSEAEASEKAAREVAETVLRERDELELQVYTLRSDFNRAVNKIDSLRDPNLMPASRANLDEVYRKLSTSLEQNQAKLMGRLVLVSSGLAGLRRIMAADHDGDGRGLQELRAKFLDLLEDALTGRLYDDAPISPWSNGYDAEVRMIGRDWPAQAQTMIGSARMRNLRLLTESVIEDGVEGDFLEAGVWRGGACIYMRGILAAYGVTDRKVWVADSFAGLPPPNPDLYPADAGDSHHTVSELAIPLDAVKGNFARYGLLDGQVEFLPGWFKDTLPTAPVERLAILRLDGDMYQSTMETLESLYAKVSPGGYVIVDDYILTACKQAVDDFRRARGIREPVEDVDGAAVYWRKEA